MKEQIQKEYEKRILRGYTDEQLMLWWSGVCTAWKLLKNETPPEPEWVHHDFLL